MFKISWGEKAYNELEKLEPIIARRIVKKVKQLENDPYSMNIKKLKGQEGFRLRIGDYRVIFYIEKNDIFILKVGHRKNIYD